jgi:hypothetical protein
MLWRARSHTQHNGPACITLLAGEILVPDAKKKRARTAPKDGGSLVQHSAAHIRWKAITFRAEPSKVAIDHQKALFVPFIQPYVAR